MEGRTNLFKIASEVRARIILPSPPFFLPYSYVGHFLCCKEPINPTLLKCRCVPGILWWGLGWGRRGSDREGRISIDPRIYGVASC